MATTLSHPAVWSPPRRIALVPGTVDGWPAKSLLVLNLLDGLFTAVFLQLGLAEELNPLMRAAWEGSPLSFMSLKLGVVQLGVWILCLNQELRIVRSAVLGAVGLYAGVVVYHLGFLATLLLR